ncbi:MAG: type I glutamate--ammonia ligase [Candidatus Nezhaarchaeales archaeon]
MPYKVVDGRYEPLRLTPDEVLGMLRELKVRFVDLQFTDVRGRLQHTTITSHSLDKGDFERGVPKLDGSSIRGFAEVQASDMVLVPDPSTFSIIPWSSPECRTARLICDVYLGFGEGRLTRDPRYAAQRAERLLTDELGQGSVSYWGPEPEFFIFDRVEWDALSPRAQSYRIESREAAWSPGGQHYPIRFKEGYLPAPPHDTLAELRSECVRILEEYFHIPCTVHHHEVATAGQGEINFRFDTLTSAADSTVTLKYVVKNVARAHGVVATFMPKPLFGDNGSGMHVNVSVWRDGRNLFYDPDDPYAELSQLGRYFVGGLLEHAEALSAIVAPTTNSYRRLVPGYEAPVYITWGRGNRSACVRVPAYHRGLESEPEKRVEFRPPDPSCNPYLCFAAMLAAGLDGIKKKRDAGEPVDENVYRLTPGQRRELGIRELPSSLEEAVECLESDREFLKPVFSQDLIDSVIENALRECREVGSRPHPYEFYLYFDA